MSYVSRLHVLSFLVLTVFVSNCNKESGSSSAKVRILNEAVILNPSGIAPLTASIHLETSSPVKVQVRVRGKHGDGSDVTHAFSTLASSQDVNILGLYPAYKNTVDLSFFDQSGSNLGTKSYNIQTAGLIPGLPQITIKKALTEKMAQGMTLVSYMGFEFNQFPQTPFIFDAWGDIRWYFNFEGAPDMTGLFYDDGVERLQNGNLYFGDISTSLIYEYDMMGYRKNTWPLPGYHFHHQVLEKPNGNFLVCASRDGESTIEDFILELDRSSKSIIRVWDLRQSLDYDRIAMTSNRQDWIHVNAIDYDPVDGGIIVSGRTQGVVKLDENNHVVWILGNHKDWGIAGDGTNLNDFLLTPLDANGNVISDIDILNGTVNAPDFEWNWYQHATKLLPNGNLMLFDNGDNRNYIGSGPYSRAVEYQIDPAAKTVKQIWTYGKENGSATYSSIVSDVDFLANINHVIFSPGAISTGGETFGEIQEVDYTTRELIFDVKIKPPQPFYIITFHRTERLHLYPGE